MATTHTCRYAARFARVFDHIHRNLSGGLSLDRLSDVANFSKFHVHRQSSQYAGISLNRYIHLIRMRRAARLLVLEP